MIFAGKCISGGKKSNQKIYIDIIPALWYNVITAEKSAYPVLL